MEKYSIDTEIPMSSCTSDIKHHVLMAENLQEAVDMTYCRSIFNGENFLKYLSAMGEEPVVKRDSIKVTPYHKWNSQNNVTDIYEDNEGFDHPSRLNDSEIKKVLLRDAKINNFAVKKADLENMVFLI